jgi:ankyrin repeat protein
VTPLSLAATNGSAAMMEALLKAGANPNLALPSGETPLMTAARTGTVAAVQQLVDHGVDVNRTEPSKGQTALMWAVADEHVDVARLLLAHKANINARSTAGFTPIMFAARQGNLEMTKLLLGSGANVNDMDGAGVGVLVVATVRGHTALAEYLLNNGADPNAQTAGYTALHWAASKVELNEFPTHLGKWHEWNVLGGVVDRREDLIKALLSHGADPNARLTKGYPRFSNEGGGFRGIGATPLMVAAANADLETMRLLVANGADPLLKTNDSATAAIIAVGRPSGDAQDPTPQEEAVEAVRLALSFGVDPNAADAAGETALHTAAYLGYEKVSQLLVEQGANVNQKNKRGETPLRIAMGVDRGALRFPGFPIAADMLRKLGGVEK